MSRKNTELPGTPARTSPTAGWTTKRWLTAGVSAALVVLLALGIVGTWVLSRATTVTSTMVNRSSPALIDALRLELALVNQETGIRGYGLSGQRSFLEPYTTGLADGGRPWPGWTRCWPTIPRRRRTWGWSWPRPRSGRPT